MNPEVINNLQKKSDYFLWAIMENSISSFAQLIAPRDKFFMLYVHSGKGKITQGESCWYIERGNLLILRFGLAFYIRAMDEPLVFTSFLISGAGDNLPFISEIQPNSKMASQIEEFCQMSFSLFGVAIPQFGPFFAFLESNGCQIQPVKHLNSMQIETLKQILDSRFAQTLHLEQCAEELHLNKYKLIKDFKSRYGLPPIEYLINRRIQEACRLLQETDKSVTEIGNEIGIDNTPYFIRTFKKKVGCTPYTYRKSLRWLSDDK